LLAVQLVASVSFLWLAVAITRTPLPLDRGARRAALSGVLEPGLAYAAGTSGLWLTGAANASLIGATEPLLVVLIAWVAFRHRPPLQTLAAIGVAVIGVALVSAHGWPGALHAAAGSASGDLLIVAGTVFAALYVVVTSRLATQIAPLALAGLQQGVGLVFAVLLLASVLAAGWEAPDLVAVPPAIWLLALASGVVQYALAFYFYLVGVRVLPVATAALFLALIPVFGAGGAALFLAEALGPLQLLGCALVVGSLAGAARAGERTTVPI
jgi:drug/metabolite transporter (DMT)-like permease